jgi:lipopolysaccharide transport system ATP-binding protein
MNMNFSIYDHIGQPVMQFRSKDRSPRDQYEPENPRLFICDIEKLMILPGRYRVDVGIVGDNRLQDYIEAATFFDVAEGFIDERLERQKEKFSVSIPHVWTLPVEE